MIMSETEKVELEQVPLKSDTDAPAGAEQKEEEAKPTPPKKTWFFKKTTTVKKGPAAEGGETAVEIPEEKEKKRCWFWQRKCTGAAGSEQEQKDAGVSIGIDLVNRDENHINEHVKFGFEVSLLFPYTAIRALRSSFPLTRAARVVSCCFLF